MLFTYIHIPVKTIRRFALLFVILAGLNSCVASRGEWVSHHYENGTSNRNWEHTGYESVHSRPPID
ncbi:MAG: hypothetical protein JWP78_1589 [Mucilaginibacter sp.]|nr:hypothetical protein [Mucilaginibacter sp.]